MLVDHLDTWWQAHRARNTARTFRLAIAAWSTPLARHVLGAPDKPPVGCPPSSRGETRRAGRSPGPPGPAGARKTLDLVALQRWWDTVTYDLHELVELARLRPTLVSDSASQEAIRLIAEELQPLKQVLPKLEVLMVTGRMRPEDYALVGEVLHRLAHKWDALPDNPPPDPPGTVLALCPVS